MKDVDYFPMMISRAPSIGPFLSSLVALAATTMRRVIVKRDLPGVSRVVVPLFGVGVALIVIAMRPSSSCVAKGDLCWSWIRDFVLKPPRLESPAGVGGAMSPSASQCPVAWSLDFRQHVPCSPA